MHFEKLLDFFFQSALPYCCLRWTINMATYPFTSNLVPRRFFHSIHLSQSTSDRAFLLIFCWASVCPCVIFFHIFDFFPRTTELVSTKLDTNHPYVKGSKVVYFKEQPLFTGIYFGKNEKRVWCMKNLLLQKQLFVISKLLNKLFYNLLKN